MTTNYDHLDSVKKCQLICSWIDHLEGSQKAFAEKLQIHINTPTNWRSNRQAPGRDTVNLVLKTYNINMAQYMAGPPEAPFKEAVKESYTLPADYARILDHLEEKHKLPANILLCAFTKVFNDWKTDAQRSFLVRYFQILSAEYEESQGLNPEKNDPPSDEKRDQERE